MNVCGATAIRHYRVIHTYSNIQFWGKLERLSLALQDWNMIYSCSNLTIKMSGRHFESWLNVQARYYGQKHHKSQNRINSKHLKKINWKRKLNVPNIKYVSTSFKCPENNKLKKVVWKKLNCKVVSHFISSSIWDGSYRYLRKNQRAHKMRNP